MKLRNVKETWQLSHLPLLMLSHVKQVVLNGLGVKLPMVNPRTRKIAFHSSSLLIMNVYTK